MTTKPVYLDVGSIAHLENGGSGIVFKVKLTQAPEGAPEYIPAFAVRYQDKVVAYKNICGHIAVNLDYVEGQFFDEEGEHLVCSTHGALYQAGTGKCMGGPCFGVGLSKLESEERDGNLYLTDPQVAAVLLKD